MPVQFLNFYIQNVKQVACQMLKYQNIIGKNIEFFKLNSKEFSQMRILCSVLGLCLSKCPKGINLVTVLEKE